MRASYPIPLSSRKRSVHPIAASRLSGCESGNWSAFSVYSPPFTRNMEPP